MFMTRKSRSRAGKPSPRLLRFLIVVLACMSYLSLGGTLQAWPSSPGTAPTGPLGSIEFPTSGTAEAQPHFLRGVAALHSFWYEEALEAFRRATTIDPNFAMAYWGEALAHNHPIWKEENMEAARAALQQISVNATLTDRERRYLDAVQSLFGEGDKLTRDRAYTAHMESLAGHFPEDLEATCLYALSLLGLATHYDHQPTLQQKYRVQAGALTLGVYGINPNHPCAAHYTIHAFDDPVHAILALPQARRYASIAPEAHHAQHMPAHIFLQLGMWEEAAASNKAGWEHSQAWVRDKQLPLALQDYHSLAWLHYTYLQQGRYNAAAALILEKQQDMAQASDTAPSEVQGYPRTVSRNYDHMVAAYIMETERWDQAKQEWQVKEHPFGDESPEKGAYVRKFSELMGAIRNQGLVLRIHPGMVPSEPEPPIKAEASTTSKIWALQLRALQQFINGKFPRVMELLNQAVELEASLPPPSGPPDLVKPTHELYGEILLFLDQPEDARQHFEQALLWHPNRARSVLGLARSAAQLGHIQATRQAYAAFLNIWQHADQGLPELKEAQQFLQETSQP